MPPRDPNRYRDFPGSRLSTVTKWSMTQTFEHGMFEIRDQFLAAVRASTDVGGQVRAFAEGMDKLEHGSRTQLSQVHDQVARLMQQAVLTQFDKSMAEFGRNLPPYRTGGGRQRDAGGVLRRALGSTNFYRGTYEGIGFVNTTLMDTRARQWHRLNFGAGNAGHYSPGKFDVRFGNLVAASFGFFDEEPSKAFFIPRGYWTGGEGRAGQFHPTSSLAHTAIPTRGIQSWNFLDAGIKVMADQLGPHYEDLYKDWYDSAQRGLGPLSRVADPPPPRRGAFSPSSV